MSRKTLLAALSALLLCVPTSSRLCADSSDACKTTDPSPLQQQKLSLDSFIEKVKKLDGPDAHLLDALFIFDVRKTPTAADVNVMGFDSAQDPGGARRTLAGQLYFAAQFPNLSGLDPALIPANSSQYFALLSSKAGSLDLQTKFLLLALLGNGLSGCYNQAAPGSSSTSMDHIFTSLRAGTNDCGVCHDIHSFLAQAAQALGFVDTGTHTANWRESKDSSGSHDVMQMRDPKTGLYYVQNYGQIISTNEKILTRAIDVSTAVLGPLSGISLVESKPGTVHIYQPMVTRWVKQSLDEAAALGPGRSMVTMHLGNREQTFRFELGSENAKAFAMHTNYNTSGGPYSLTALGVAGQLELNKKYEAKWVSEVGMSLNAYAGGLRIVTPFIQGSPNADPGESSAERMNLFGALKINGYARVNSVTGKLEVNGNMVDFDPRINGGINFQLPPYHEIKPSLTYAPQGLPLKVEAARVMQISTVTIPDQNPKLRTAYDKLDVVIDTRGGANKPYIVSETGIYAFEGAETWAAVGLKEHFKAVLPNEKLGQFYVLFDASAVVANRAKDPFYEAPLALSFGAGWTKRIGKMLDIGADLSANNSVKPFYLFETPGTITPEMGHTDGFQLMGNVWLGGKFP